MKHLFLISITMLSLALGCVTESFGIPAFSRKYKTSCSTCHYVFPMLNAFGKAFRNNGYRFPAGHDAEMTKEKPVSLGSDANKNSFPDAIWPADIPGTAPISLLATGIIAYDAMSEVKWGFEIPNTIEILSGGTIGEDFSFLGKMEFENHNNSTELSFAAFVQYDNSPAFHVKAGEVQSDPAYRQLRLTTNRYNTETLLSRNGWSFSDPQFGIEVWGALKGFGNRGGLTYRAGVVNGTGLTSLKPQKDFFGRITYKFGGLTETGVVKRAGTGPKRPYIDNSITLGGFFYRGTEVKEGAGDEKLTVLGGDFDLWFDRFTVTSTLMLMNSDMPDTAARNSLAYFIQTTGMVYPWLLGLARYERTDADVDNGTFKPVHSIILGVSVLLRANLKLNFEVKKYLDEANEKNTTFSGRISLGV